MTWNFDISQAPRGRNETRSQTVRGKTREYSVFVPDRLLVCAEDRKVYATYWLEPTRFCPSGRWAGWSEGQKAVAWMPFPKAPVMA